MKKRLKMPLFAFIILAVSLPTGFAIAQVADQPESEAPPLTHADPDPSTDAIEIGEAFKKARESGDPEAIQKAADAVRAEWFSRQGPEEKEGARTAPKEPDVPAGTYAYINDAINGVQITECRNRLAEGHDDELCELIVLYGEGRINAGPYTKDQVEAILNEKGETR